MQRQLKTRLMVSLSVFALVSILLSISLSNFSPEAGIPVSDIVSTKIEITNSHGRGELNVSDLIPRILLSLLLLTVLFFIIRKVKKFQPGKELLSVIVLASGIATILFIAYCAVPGKNPGISTVNEVAAPVERVDIDARNKSPLPSHNFPTFLIYIVGVILLGSILTFITIMMFSRERFDAREEKDLLDLLAQEAALTSECIETGRDLKGAIIQCYRNMCLLLQREQGVEREQYMTVRDFEKRLENLTISGPAVRHLSGLFETVRYGRTEPAQNEEKRAIECLEDIKEQIQLLKRRNQREKK